MSPKQFLSAFVRGFVVMLCFTMDIKIYATPSKREVVVTGFREPVELEVQNKSMDLEKKMKLPNLSRLEVMKEGEVELSIPQGTVVAFENSFIHFAESKYQLLDGQYWLTLNEPTKFESIHGRFELSKGEYLVKITKAKSSFQVLDGKVVMIDRSSGQKTLIPKGQMGWIGGLLAEGSRAVSMPEVMDLIEVEKILSFSGRFDEKSLETKMLPLIELRDQTANRISKQIQESLSKEMVVYSTWIKEWQEKTKAQEEENLKLRKLFRAKVFGLPLEYIDRFPASEQ